MLIQSKTKTSLAKSAFITVLAVATTLLGCGVSNEGIGTVNTTASEPIAGTVQGGNGDVSQPMAGSPGQSGAGGMPGLSMGGMMTVTGGMGGTTITTGGMGGTTITTGGMGGTTVTTGGMGGTTITTGGMGGTTTMMNGGAGGTTMTTQPPPNGTWVAGEMAIAVGQGGRTLHTSDGQTWLDDSKGQADNPHMALSQAAEGKGLVIAVGGGCDKKRCEPYIRHFNGKVWSDYRIEHTNWLSLYGVAFGNGRWLTVGMQGIVGYTDDGVRWTQSDRLDKVKDVYAIGFGQVGGDKRFVAVGKYSLRLSSKDGIAWGEPTWGEDDLAQPMHSVAFGNNVVVAAGEGGRRSRSTDGNTWTHDVKGGENIIGLFFHQGKFSAYTKDGIVFESADDGKSWTPTTVINGPDAFVALGRLNGKTIYLGAARDGTMMYSDNGKAFQKASGYAQDAQQITRIMFAGQ